MGIKKTQLKRADKQNEFAQHETKPWKINVESDKYFELIYKSSVIWSLCLIDVVYSSTLSFIFLTFFWSQCDPLSLIETIFLKWQWFK